MDLSAFNLQGKVALITGGAHGIGFSIAEGMAKCGAVICFNCSSEASLEKGMAAYKAVGIDAHGYVADVSDEAAVNAMVAKIKAEVGSVDILVNNAGISHIGLFTDMTPEQWQHVLNVNLGSVLNCTHLAVPAMVHNKTGVILNISSMWGEAGASCEAVYSASKGGINAFTKAMAKELGPSGIRVNAIACGVIDTEMNACFSEEERAELADEIALMRFGKPEEVGRFALTLASESASFLTGQIITLDGGML